MGGRAFDHLRPPMHLRQRRRDDCVACVAGQILYVFGVTDVPDLAAIERRGTHKSNEPMPGPDAFFYLLEQGFSYCAYTTYDREEFLQGGVEYLRAHFGAKWGSEHERYFTEELVTRNKQLTREDITRERQYAGRIQHIPEEGTIESIRAMVQKGWVVDVTEGTGARLIQHAALIVPHQDHPDGKMVWFYSPRPSGQTVSVEPLKRLAKRLALEREVTGVCL